MAPENLAKGMAANLDAQVTSMLQANNKFMQELIGVVNLFKDKFEKDADEKEKSAEQLNKAVQEQTKQGRSRGKKSLLNMTSNDLTSAVRKGVASALGKGSGVAGAAAGAAPGAKAAANIGGLSTVRVKATGDGKADGTEYGHEFAHSVGTALEMTIGRVVTGFIGGASAYQLIAKDMIEQEYEFAMGMNMIAFQTKAIANDAPGMQKAFRATADVVRTTGFDLTTYQHALMAATKRGLTDAQSITKTGLNLGKMMGLNEQEAAGIADQFANWNQHLGMDSLQIADISRGIQDVSKSTGLVGQNLANAVKSAERFMNEMRSAGTLTAASAKNMILLAANAQKLGIDQQMSELMNGLASGANLLLKSSNNAKNILMLGAQAGGVMREAMDGTLTETQGGLKKLASGYEQVFKNISGGIDIGDIDNLSAARKSQLNIVVQSAFGMGLDDYKRVVEATKNSGRSLEETMMGITAELGKNATEEEKRAAQLKKEQLIMSKSFEFSSKLTDAAKSADNFDEAIGNMQKKMSPQAWQESMQDLSTVAGTFSQELKDKVLKGDNKAIAESMALSAGEALKKAGGKDFTAQIKKAIGTKDLTKLRALQADMNKEQQKLGVEQINALDPMAAAAQELKVMNENIRFFTGPAIVALTTLVGSVGVIAAMMSAGALSAIFNPAALMAYFDVFKSGIQMVIGKGVQKAATAVGSMAVGEMAAGAATAAGGAAAAEGGGMVAAAAGTATALWPVYAALAAIAGVVGGVVGNLSAGAAAADLFDTSVEDLTLAQYYAAKGAGTLTGALNFLTFGVFNKWLGATGSVTKALAHLNEKIPILSAAAAIIDVIAGVIWGTVKAIGNIVAGIGEMVYLVFEPFGAIFSAIGEVIMAILSPFSAFTTTLSETGSLFQIVSDIIGGLGMTIRWVLRIIGKTIGFLIKSVLTPFVATIKAIAGAISGALKPVGRAFDALMQAGMGLLNFFQGLFTFDFSKVWSGLLNALKGVIKSIINSIIALPMILANAILGAISSFANYVGSMFDNVEGTIGSILQLWAFGWKFVGQLASAIMDTLDGVWEALVGIFTLDMSKLKSGITKIIFAIPTMLWEAAKGFANLLGDVLLGIPIMLLDGLKSVLIDFPRWLMRMLMEGLRAVFVTLPKMLWDTLMSGIASLASNDWVGPIFEPFLEILTPLNEAFQGLWSALGDLFSAVSELFAPFKSFAQMMGIGGDGAFSWVGVLQTAVKALATVIGGLIRIALTPLMWVVKLVSKAVNFFTSILNAMVAKIKEWVDYIKSLPIIGRMFADDTEKTADATSKAAVEAGKAAKSAQDANKPKTATTTVAKQVAMATKTITNNVPTRGTSLVEEGIAKGGPEFLKANAERLASLDEYNKNNEARRSTRKQMLAASTPVDTDGKALATGAGGSFFDTTVKQNLADKFGKAFNPRGRLDTSAAGNALAKGAKTEQAMGSTRGASIPPPAMSLDEMQLRNAIAAGGTSPAIPLAMRDEEIAATPAAQPAGMNDVHAKMQREQAATMATTKRSSVPETAELVAINQSQLQYLMIMHGDLERLIGLMTPSGGNSSGLSLQQQQESTSSKTKPINSPNYHQWQFGRYQQNASTNVITDGR